MKQLQHSQLCVCGSSLLRQNCCGPLLDGAVFADSAERLMRSRYSAYVEQNASYLLSTWHASTRPISIKLDSLTTIKWFRLVINASLEDQVTFTAWYKENGKASKLQEQSQFVLENGRWYYLSGISPSLTKTK